MVNKISVIGGDLRIVKLVEMLSKDGYEIWTYGLDKAESIGKLKEVNQCDTIEELFKKSDVIIHSTCN